MWARASSEASHFGGFAKVTQELFDFIDRFRSEHDIQLDPIYTGKMMKGLFVLIDDGLFPAGTTIIAVHTGGASPESWEGLRPSLKKTRL